MFVSLDRLLLGPVVDPGPAELLGIIIQITSAIFDGVPHPLSWWVSSKDRHLCCQVYSNRKLGWLDLFSTFTNSFYNTTFKILFIGSSAYIIYLMLNDYKPTHDPNLDTFKVQYLLGFSALFALIFSHDYRVSEVSLWMLVRHNMIHWQFQRCFGHSPFGLNLLLFYHSFSCCSEPEKLIP